MISMHHFFVYCYLFVFIKNNIDSNESINIFRMLGKTLAQLLKLFIFNVLADYW